MVIQPVYLFLDIEYVSNTDWFYYSSPLVLVWFWFRGFCHLSVIYQSIINHINAIYLYRYMAFI